MDNLAPLARKILKLSADASYEKLVIAPGDGNPAALADLTAATNAGPRTLFPTFVTQETEATCLLAALWLWQDYLTESHELSQSVETATGSYWHAILHRREGDFSNAKYWYARAAGHPAYPSFANNAAVLLRDSPADKRLLRLFSPDTAGAALTDLADAAHTLPPSDPRHRTAVSLQQLEFRTLFEFTVSAAQR